MIPEWIMSFIKEISPGSEELYLSCFSEKTCLTDATNLIKKLRAENQRMREALEEVYSQISPWSENCDYRAEEDIKVAMIKITKAIKEIGDE